MAGRRNGGRRGGGRRRNGGMTIPLAVVAGFLPGAWRLWEKRGSLNALGNEAGRIYLGYDSWTGQFGWSQMKFGTLPIIAGAVMHRLVGGTLGVNKMLSRAGVPFIRI